MTRASPQGPPGQLLGGSASPMDTTDETLDQSKGNSLLEAVDMMILSSIHNQ